MIVYYYCLCRTKDKFAARQFREQGIEVRITRRNPEYAKEASGYGLKLPIIVENGVAKSL